MIATYKILINNSLAAAISSIEIYNKPDFQYRNESFVILMINAWELLLKAKILQDNRNLKSSLYIRGKGNKYKRSRTGNYLTIEITSALKRLEVNKLVQENIENILEIRDTAIHFYNKDTISYTIFTLGLATLQNYQKLIKLWFGRDLSEYNFYILPLGFNYSFKNFQQIKMSNEPQVVKNLLNLIVEKQIKGEAENDGYYLVADIKTNVVSAKKMIHDSDLTIKIDPNADGTGVLIYEKPIDKYPYTAMQIANNVGERFPLIGTSKVWKFIRKHKMKDNNAYSMYNFPSKMYETEFRKGKRNPPLSLYNDNALRYILANIND